MKALTSERPDFQDWIQAARLKFLPQGVMPVVIAGALAFSEGTFDIANFVVAFSAAAAVQIGLTMFNDTLDYVYGTDCKPIDAKNPFSGGSGVFTCGIIKPRQSLMVIFALYFFALLCAVYMALDMGWGVMWIAIIGAAISILYSAKPLRLAYHGLGELMMLIGYGPVLTAWGYFVHTGMVSLDILLIGVIPGLCMWAMILINEIPDYLEDRAAGKRNLTYRLGPKNAKNLFFISLLVLYAYILALVFNGIMPPLSAISLGGIPLAVMAVRIAHRYYNDPIKVAMANKLMVIIYSVTTATVAIGMLT
ncbi:prenyltransferase [Dehalococcoides mccartyi]|uniref:1,4-dihydroxy-2-naphthoateoctaprenyltransferase n=1 Tax=Dehalococcoides mccartyi (strain VS) TaxID=311424 RepID=D2BGQ1_DEHMV|nr:prenyltransferase [Dehalococcoides mccartyi]ACZ61501.1 1,4-dihydroxy-2-naphthoateoctaprenyltransferase [Dehalococcoides mccartyi VS]